MGNGDEHPISSWKPLPVPPELDPECRRKRWCPYRGKCSRDIPRENARRSGPASPSASSRTDVQHIDVQNGIATLQIIGSISGDVARIGEELEKVLATGGARGIFLEIVTTGGKGAPAARLADVIEHASVPSVAFVAAYCLSAGMEVLGAANRAFGAHEGTEFGAIGSKMTLCLPGGDVRVLCAGSEKIANGDTSVPHVREAMSEEQLEEVQMYLLDSQRSTIAGLCLRRRLPSFDRLFGAVASGRTFGAAEAERLGLLDGICTRQEALDQLRALMMDGGSMTAQDPGLRHGKAGQASPSEPGGPGGACAELSSGLPESPD